MEAVDARHDARLAGLRNDTLSLVRSLNRSLVNSSSEQATLGELTASLYRNEYVQAALGRVFAAAPHTLVDWRLVGARVRRLALTALDLDDRQLQQRPLSREVGVQVDLNDDAVKCGIDSDEVLISLEMAFNTRKLFSTFDENTGEIYLAKADKIVPFERAVRKCVNAGAKASTDATTAAACAVRLFDPRSGKELSVHDAIERGIVHRKTGMIVDPKAGNLLSIREAVKRCIVSVSGAPVVTGRHGGYEAPLAITASAADAQLTSAHSQSHLAAGVLHLSQQRFIDWR